MTKTNQLSMLPIFSKSELFGLEFAPAFEQSNKFDRDKYVVVTIPISAQNIIIKFYIEEGSVNDDKLESKEFLDSLMELYMEYFIVMGSKKRLDN